MQMVKEGKRGLDVSRVRSLARSEARKQYGGPNSMKQCYKDAGAAAWWVDGYGHGGIFVGVWDHEKTSLVLRKETAWNSWRSISKCFFDGRDHDNGLVLTLYVYEEDCEWSKFILDNPGTCKALASIWRPNAKKETPEKFNKFVEDLPSLAQKTFDRWYGDKKTA